MIDDEQAKTLVDEVSERAQGLEGEVDRLTAEASVHFCDFPLIKHKTEQGFAGTECGAEEKHLVPVQDSEDRD